MTILKLPCASAGPPLDPTHIHAAVRSRSAAPGRASPGT